MDRFADRELDAKRNENQLATQSRIAEQNAILATAEEEFRASVKNELQRDGEKSGQMQQRFQKRKQNLVDIFLKKADKLEWIPEQTKELQLEKLKAWASVKLKKRASAKQKEEVYVERLEEENKRRQVKG